MSSLFTHVPILTGKHVRLEPLSLEHTFALREAVGDGELWKLWYTSVPSPEKVEHYIKTALAEHAAGKSLPFVVKTADGDVIGSTRFCNIEADHYRLEIGYTWYAKRVQRTALNTEAKQLLLIYAFDNLKCIAVEFRTHFLNFPSRAAITRLGAKQDGILRNHRRMPDGSLRDTVVFSIIQSEWPAIKNHLDYLLVKYVI